jgi:hypothetical protein
MSKQQYVVGLKYQLEAAGAAEMQEHLPFTFKNIEAVVECCDVYEGCLCTHDIILDNPEQEWGHPEYQGHRLFPVEALRGEIKDHQVTLVE